MTRQGWQGLQLPHVCAKVYIVYTEVLTPCSVNACSVLTG